MSQAPWFASDDILRFPPRLPGEALHQSLLDFSHAQEDRTKHSENPESNAHGQKESVAVSKKTSRGSTVTENPVERGSVAPASPGRNNKREKRKTVTTVIVENNDDMHGGKGDGERSEDDEEGENDDGSVFAMAAYGDESWLEPLPASRESNTSGSRDGGMGWSGGNKESPVAVVPEWDRVPTARESGRACDVVVTGPPLSGRSTVSHALARRYGVPALSVDVVVKEAMRLRNKLGAKVRAAMHWFTAREEVRKQQIAHLTSDTIPAVTKIERTPDTFFTAC